MSKHIVVAGSELKTGSYAKRPVSIGGGARGNARVQRRGTKKSTLATSRLGFYGVGCLLKGASRASTVALALTINCSRRDTSGETGISGRINPPPEFRIVIFSPEP